MAYVEHKPCAACGAPPNKTCILLSPPLVREPLWMCWDCYLLTPAGAAQMQEQIKRSLGELDGLQSE